MIEHSELCPLCGHVAVAFYREIYYQCARCYGLFRPPCLLLSPELEKARYEKHNNSVNDVRYQQFVSPVVNAVLRDFLPEHRGLDFGAGTGPVISHLLEQRGYQIRQYDPFFHNYPELLTENYDYIVCCEVIEHFYKPAEEFFLLRGMLANKGRLYCMTELYQPGIDFNGWRYPKDETHVFIYQRETLEWVKQAVGFTSMSINGRLIQFDR